MALLYYVAGAVMIWLLASSFDVTNDALLISISILYSAYLISQNTNQKK